MSALSEAQEAPPFAVLTDWLVAAARNEGSINVPDEILALFKSNIIDDDNGIRKLVKVFGTSDHSTRLRLDHAAFINIVAILLHLPYSNYQEKLLFNFMATIELLKDVSKVQTVLQQINRTMFTAEEIDTKRQKINNKLIPKMMRVLVLDEQEVSMRLMAARFLFSLLRDCAEAQYIVRRHPEIVKLGPLIDEDDDYVLRLSTANLVRELCLTTSKVHDFWPQMSEKMKKKKNQDFPLSQKPDWHWVNGIANYLSSIDVNRGFRGDIHPFVTKLLSVDTGSHILEQKVGAEILAVVAEKFVFVIPSTARTPFVLLELFLDSHCNCLVDEHTPDLQPEIRNDVTVLIEANGTCYQTCGGAKNALEKAKLVLAGFEQAEAYVQAALQSLRSLPSPPPKPKDGPAKSDVSSRTQSRSFRRLDVGMIDMSTDSDADTATALMSEGTPLVGTLAPVDRRELSRFRSRQSSRMTEAKLKEAYHNKSIGSASFPPQGSLILGEQGYLVEQPRSIGPCPPELHNGENVQIGADAGLAMKMDFATYIDQTSQDKLRPEQETGRSNAKPFFPYEGSREPHRLSFPQQHLDSSPSSRAYRSASKKSVANTLELSSGHPLLCSVQSNQSLIQTVHSEHNSEDSSPPPLHSRKASLESTETSGKNMSEANGAKCEVQSNRKHTLNRPSKSQFGTAYHISGDSGDMADEHNALPATKKPRLQESAAKKVRRESQPLTSIDKGSKQSGYVHAGQYLKRPKALEKDSQVSLQETSISRHDDFDLKDEDGPTVSDPIAKKTATTRTTTRAGRKTDLHMSKTNRSVPTKPNSKGRKVIQPVEINVTSLASTRARRKQTKSKVYINDSDAEPNLKATDEEAQNAAQDTKKALNSNTHMTATFDNLNAPVTNQLWRDTEVSAQLVSDHIVETHPHHQAFVGAPIPESQVHEAIKVPTAHETLVTASPPRHEKRNRQAFGGKNDDRFDMESPKRSKATAQEASAGVHAERAVSPDETAEDSYPMVATKSWSPRASFGSKLGSILQSKVPQETKASTMATQTTPLSNTKSFLKAVNETRSTSSKKKIGNAITAEKPEVEAADSSKCSGTLRGEAEKHIYEEVTTATVTKENQEAPLSNQNANAITSTSRGVLSTSIGAQQKHTTVLGEAEDPKEPENERKAIAFIHSRSPQKTASSNIRSLRQQEAKPSDVASRQQDVISHHEDGQSHSTGQVVKPKDSKAFIDLTQASDEVVPVTDNSHLDPDKQDNFESYSVPVPANALLTCDLANEETQFSQQDERSIGQLTHVSRPNLYTDVEAATKTPKSTKVASLGRSPRTCHFDTLKHETSILADNTTKKAQLVHFGTHGPLDQARLSPNRKGRKSIVGTVLPAETQKQQAYEHMHSVGAASKYSVIAPRLQAGVPDSVAEVGTNDQAIFVEDNANIEDIGESSEQDRGNTPCEESAPVLTGHLPSKTFTLGRSGSHSSWVDENGSPRPQSRHFTIPADLATSDEAMTGDNANNNINLEGEDLSTTTEQSDSAETTSQDSDPSFHLTLEARVPHQSDRSTRTRTQAATAVTPACPKTVEQAEQRRSTTAMNFKNRSRESLGINKIVREQYPLAKRIINMRAFKKPDPKTNVSEPLVVSTRMPMVDHKTKAESSDVPREPLKEMSMNKKTLAVATQSSPNCESELSSASPVQVTKPSKTPFRPQLISDATRSTSASLKTTLLAKQPDKYIRQEDTILENLNRGKSACRHAVDADRTLVEGTDKYYCRQPSDLSSVSSGSRSSEAGLEKAQRFWHKGSRAAQMDIRDTLLEITSNVLFRLESEEKAIDVKANEYDSGCNNILKQFQNTGTKLFQHTGVALLKKATGTSGKLDAAFDRLQARKISVRSADTKDYMQRAVKLRHNTLAEEIEQMLEAEREKVDKIKEA